MYNLARCEEVKLLNANEVNNLNTYALNKAGCEHADAAAEAAFCYSRYLYLQLRT